MARAFDSGSKHVRKDLILWCRLGEGAGKGGEPRLGLSVSRKLGDAVRRNRVKRLLREALRLNKERLRSDADLVFYPRPGCAWEGLKDAVEAVFDLCRKGKVLR